MQIRRTLAVAALSALGLAGLVAAPANADSQLTCDGIEQSVAELREARNEARQQFLTYNGARHGKLVKVERAEARAEIREAHRALRAGDKAMRKELAQANRVLRSDKAVRAEIRVERRAYKQTWAHAQKALVEALEFRADCAEVEDENEVEETEADEETDAEDGGVVAARGKEN
jgi:hypothetical protein